MNTASARWRRSQIAETFASVRVSAPCYSLAEYVGLFAIVKSELKLSKIERGIFLAHVVVRPDDSALEQRPERIDALCVDFAAHIFLCAMIDGSMPETHASQIAVVVTVIGRDQGDFVGNSFTNKFVVSIPVSLLDHFANHIALARDRADHFGLTLCSPSATALPDVLVAFFPADVGFVHFHDAHQLLELRVFHSSAESHAHIPSGLILAGSEHPVNLQGADAFLGCEHPVENLEPHAERLLGFLEDRSGLEREAIGRAIILAAFLALPVPRARLAFIHVIVAATRTLHAIRPAPREQICPTGFLIGGTSPRTRKASSAEPISARAFCRSSWFVY